jgi:hypothetical protein
LARLLAGSPVVPKSGWSMAAGPERSIYIVDTAREAVLR